jgi:hypothetical protein
VAQRLSLPVAAAALAVALLGATPLGQATAHLVLPRGSVGTAQLADGAVTAAKVKDRSLLARDFKPGELPRGAQGPPGPAGTIEGVAAGGDLAGAYPSPTIAPDAVSGAEIDDGSLQLGDTAVLSGQVRVNPPPVAAHSCVSQSAPVPGLKPYDRTLVLPTQNLPPGLFVTQIFNTNTAGRALFRLCNATPKALDPPLGGWAYVVWRP